MSSAYDAFEDEPEDGPPATCLPFAVIALALVLATLFIAWRSGS